MEIKAVLFDMDGLIFDTQGLYKVNWQYTASEEGFELDDDFYQTFIGGQGSECERWVAAKFGEGLDLERFKEIRSRGFHTRRAKDVAYQHGFDPLLGY